VAHAWGGADDKARPASRSGLRLQRCAGGAAQPALAPHKSPGGECLDDFAEIVKGARGDGITILARAVLALEANPWSEATRRNVECYFPTATADELAGPFRQAANLLAIIEFACPNIPFDGFSVKTPDGKVEELKTEPGIPARSLLVGKPDGSGPAAQKRTVLFPEFFDPGGKPGTRVRTVIHESFHHALFGGDALERSNPTAAYDPICGTLDKKDALGNADSYAQLALRLGASSGGK
jgi:hypothetical protein